MNKTTGRDGQEIRGCVDKPRRRRSILPLVAIGLIQLLLVPASFAAGGSSTTVPAGGSTPSAGKKNVVTFGTQTSSATTPDARGYYAFGATPGGQISDYVAVINYSDQAATLLLRPVDGINTPQGGFAAVPINQKSKEVGTWISVPPAAGSLNLAPRTNVIVAFQVHVPKDATPGDHFGVVTATLVSSAVSPSGQRIQLFQTVGTRVFIRVSGPLHPSIAVENLKVHYNGTLNPVGTGNARLTYTVHNTGNVALGGRQTVYVTGLFGSKRVAVSVPRIQLLLPHFSVKESVLVKGIFPEIRESGHVSITPLYIAGTVNPASGPFRGTVGFWAIPWTLLAIIVAVLLLVAWLLRRRWRRGRPVDGPGTSSDEPSPEAAVTTGEEFAPAASETPDSTDAGAPEEVPAVSVHSDHSEVISQEVLPASGADGTS